MRPGVARAVLVVLLAAAISCSHATSGPGGNGDPAAPYGTGDGNPPDGGGEADDDRGPGDLSSGGDGDAATAQLGDPAGDSGDAIGGDAGANGGDPASPYCSQSGNCTEPGCAASVYCHVPGTEICNNGLDDDDDDAVDCADADCGTFPGCDIGHLCPATPDCADPTCVGLAACRDLLCAPGVDFGVLTASGDTSTRALDTRNSNDIAVTPCAPGGAGMVVGRFELSGGPSIDLSLDFSQSPGSDHVFGVFRVGVGQGCGANPVASCVNPRRAQTGTHTFAGLASGAYYLVVQPFAPSRQGSLSVTLRTAAAVEICNDGYDNNGNGLFDCGDAQCASAGICSGQQCVADFDLGALVVDHPAVQLAFGDVGGSYATALSCQAARGGADRIARFTLHETAGVLLDWNQTGEHVVGLMRAPDPGEPCDAHEISCHDPGPSNADVKAWDDLPAGDYSLFFKVTQPGDEGLDVDAQLSAFAPANAERCHDGIDNDGDGLVDCSDPDCLGVSGCGSDYCVPDLELGTLAVGSPATVDLDLVSDGHWGFAPPCAYGGGKALVLRLLLADPGLSLRFDCTQTGNQVIDLDRDGERQRCDAKDEACAHLDDLPLGCGFEVPDLAAGAHDVIVQGYRPGSEGTMHLTLSVLDNLVHETCDDGVDNDGDMLADCADPECATAANCPHGQCQPATTIDPMPLDGSTLFELVNTRAGTPSQLTCAVVPGGLSQTIALRFTAPTDLSVQFSQVGWHDLAIAPLVAIPPCDLGLLACVRSTSINQSGSLVIPNLVPGRYALIIAADEPDGATTFSGSVNVALSATPH